jgi:hypothetical protein
LAPVVHISDVWKLYSHENKQQCIYV